MNFLKKLLLFSVLLLAFSCSDDDESSSSLPNISDNVGIQIFMDWDTENDLFELRILDESGVFVASSTESQSEETLNLGNLEDGTYNIAIEDFSFTGRNIDNEEVSFVITGLSPESSDTVNFTVNVSDLEIDEVAPVIEMVVSGDSYTFDLLDSSI